MLSQELLNATDNEQFIIIDYDNLTYERTRAVQEVDLYNIGVSYVASVVEDSPWIEVFEDWAKLFHNLCNDTDCLLCYYDVNIDYRLMTGIYYDSDELTTNDIHVDNLLSGLKNLATHYNMFAWGYYPIKTPEEFESYVQAKPEDKVLTNILLNYDVVNDPLEIVKGFDSRLSWDGTDVTHIPLVSKVESVDWDAKELKVSIEMPLRFYDASNWNDTTKVFHTVLTFDEITNMLRDSDAILNCRKKFMG